MSTYPGVAVPHRSSLLLRILLWTVIILFVLFAVAAIGFYSIARSALPQLDGTLSVPGLSAPVTVTRDHHGIPTIEAANLDDLFFAQGYVTAQDRLWQMDGMRRFAAGELSEILGPDYIKVDKEQRILGMRQAARKALTTFSPENRLRFEDYARGVNAYIDSHHDDLPLEFRILHYQPRPWTPEDSTVIAAQMVKDLNHDPNILSREKILDKLGPELAADLYPNSSMHDHPPTATPSSLEGKPADDENEEDETPSPSSVTRAVPAADRDPFAVGSNDWVVSGAHTVSGKPLLSDDMHLGHQMPNLWFEAHLRSGNYDVAGVTLPGMPFVVVGHNQRIAWGFTNVGATVEDLYIETFNAEGKYKTPDGWKDPEHRSEVIHVKGKPDVTVDVILTRHGPIVSDLVPGETRKLALRWTLYEGVRNPFFAVNSAQNWDDFRRAFSEFDAPGQNVVYADVDGNIGYQATGKVPIRAKGDGSYAEDGSTNDYEWTGYIPFDKMPSVYNPPSGIIGTANGRIAPDGYPYSISAQWEAPWRTDRIYRVLQSGKKFSSADMLSLQTDIYSAFDRYAAERFVYAVDHAKNATRKAKQAVEILRSWDGRMSADSAAPTISVRSRIQLTRLLLEPKLGRESPGNPAALSWKSYRWAQQSVWLESMMLHQPKRWLPDGYDSWDDLLAAAVDAAATHNDAPEDLNSWKWGPYNPVEIQHPIFGNVPFLQNWSGPGIKPQSGSGYTVKAVSRGHGPSERMTVDLSNLDQSTLNLVTGEAGNLFSPYYLDQWKAWYEGTTFPWPFSKSAEEKVKAHQLTLQPGK
ncbi:MAG TPA: penicillin acylase family protein [Terriglobales bacterium]|nr:penicillin acylase family protein [Terriglobales bacterium]